jgi:hypothetical protein
MTRVQVNVQVNTEKYTLIYNQIRGTLAPMRHWLSP